MKGGYLNDFPEEAKWHENSGEKKTKLFCLALKERKALPVTDPLDHFLEAGTLAVHQDPNPINL